MATRSNFHKTLEGRMPKGKPYKQVKGKAKTKVKKGSKKPMMPMAGMRVSV